jgi:nucleoside-diphosphate-sugar epimerase
MRTEQIAVVAGGGGFIGGHLAGSLLEEGYRVRAIDIKPVESWHQIHTEAENLVLDLRQPEACSRAVAGASEVYDLAADMGGMGFIETNKAMCMLSVLISTQLLQGARLNDVERFFFASSACVYAADKQSRSEGVALKESDAYPAMPEDGYGWQKLFGERMCRHFTEDFGLETRVARYHNVYGPDGTWAGGREKAPAAICRKVAEAELSGRHEIEIWGDGQQVRSFTYISDCLAGTRKLMESDVREPLNVGSAEMVTINELVDAVESIAGITLERRYDLSAPLGVRGRNSDNTLISARLGWEPGISLREGLIPTYAWVRDQVAATWRRRERLPSFSANGGAPARRRAASGR